MPEAPIPTLSAAPDAEPTPAEERAGKRHRREVGARLVEVVRRAVARGETPPWRKPWSGGYGSHRSGRKGSAKAYTGLNAWATWLHALLHSHTSVLWYTRLEGERNGWTLRPAAIGVDVLSAPRREEILPNGRLRWAGFPPDRCVVQRVYNRDDFDGPPPEPPPKPWDGTRGIARVVRLAKAIGLNLVETESRAYFRVKDDHIGLPRRAYFRPEDWAATLLHEIVHWTGHARRLARFGTSIEVGAYAQEELVAELGAAMLGATFALPGTRIDDPPGADFQHKEYLTHWARRVENAEAAMGRALADAEAAIAFLEDIAPAAFRAAPEDALFPGIDAAPATLRDGACWAAAAHTLIQAPSASDPGGPAAHMDEIARWIQRWRTGRASLLFAGAPGDGGDAWVQRMRDILGEYGKSGAYPQMVRAQVLFATSDHARSLPALAVAVGQAAAATEPPVLPPWPETATAAIAALHDLTPGAILVASVRATERAAAPPESVVVIDLVRTPVATAVAHGLLAKSDPRPWQVLAHRNPRLASLAVSWSRRLRTHSPWLDGHPHHAGPDLDNRLALHESAPFLPVVLQTAQAVLDALARRGLLTKPLEALVQTALQAARPPHTTALIPLDHLLAPLFGAVPPAPAAGAAPTAEAVLLARAVRVTQLLQLCPELSRGTQALVLNLLESVDTDLDALGAEIDALHRPGTGTRRRPPLRRAYNSWFTEEPLHHQGRALGPWDGWADADEAPLGASLG